MFPRPAVDVVALASRVGQRGHFDRRRSRVRGLPEFGGELPVAVLAEEIETDGRGPDPRPGHPRRQPRALDARRRAPEPRAERPGASWSPSTSTSTRPRATRTSSCRPPARWSATTTTSSSTRWPCATRPSTRPRSSTPAKDARHDWQILLELSQPAGPRQGHAALDERAWPTRRCAAWARAACWRCCCAPGPHGQGLKPFGRGLTLKQLEAAPHGVDLGPLRAVPARAPVHARPPHRPGARAPAGRPRRGSRQARPAPTRCSSSAAATCAPTTPGCTTASAW